MDRKINKIKNLAKKEVKELTQLAKEDRKRDKVCDIGKKMKEKK